VNGPSPSEGILWRAAGIWQRVAARRLLRNQTRDTAATHSLHYSGGEETGSNQRRDDGGEEGLPSIDAGHGLKHSNTPSRRVGQLTVPYAETPRHTCAFWKTLCNASVAELQELSHRE